MPRRVLDVAALLLATGCCFPALTSAAASPDGELAASFAQYEAEVFARSGKINNAFDQARAIVDWGVEQGDPEIECRGRIRVAFAELWFGRWRNEWNKHRQRAIEIADELPQDSLARAEVLMFNGYLKTMYLDDYEGGVSDQQFAIAVGEATTDMRLLAKSHFLLSYCVILRGEVFESIEASLRSIALANHLGMARLEHAAFRAMIQNKRLNNNAALDDLPRYNQLCDQLNLPRDMSPKPATTTEQLLEVVEKTKYATSPQGAPTEEEAQDRSTEVALYASDQKRLALASIQLIRRFGDEQNDWDRAEPYITLLRQVTRQMRDPINEIIAKHYQTILLAQRGEIDAAKKLSDELIEELRGSSDSASLISFCTDQSRAFALGGAVDESHRLLDLAEEQQEQRTGKLPQIAQAKARMYLDLLIAHDAAHRVAEAQQAADTRARVTNTALAIGLPILAVVLWLGLRTAQGRRLQRELQRQLDLKTRSLQLATEQAEQANQAKTDYLARINHELRNPLGAIANSCELLELAPGETDPETTRLARRTIAAATNVLVDVVDDVLDFTRIEAGELTLHRSAFAPREMLDSVEAMIRPSLQAGVRLETILDPAVPARVVTDLPKLRQTVLNLADNAVKHTRVGKITLSIGYEPRDDSRGTLSVQITDTGGGIDPEIRPHIFDRFVTADEGPGSGLGLYISNAFAKSLGGEILCESEPGVGAAMTVRTPVETAPDLPEPTPADAIDGNRPKRVLVVDDTEAVRRTLVALLSACGFDTRSAKDWQAAEEELEAGVDLVLLDLRMPQVDGFELVRRIRSRPATTPAPRVIAVSGDATETTRAKAVAAGFDDFLAKPFTKNELLATIGTAESPAEEAAPAT